MKPLYHIGRYSLLMFRVFSKPERIQRLLATGFIHEINSIGISSLPIIAIISVFMGGIITIQAAFGFTSPLVPLYAVGTATRESMFLEFSPTVISVHPCRKSQNECSL